MSLLVVAGVVVGVFVILVFLAVLRLRHAPLSLERFRRPLEVSLSEKVTPLHATVAHLEFTKIGLFRIEITARKICLASDDSHLWVTFGHVTFRAPLSAFLSPRSLETSTDLWLFADTTIDVLAPQSPFECLHGVATATAETLRFDITGGRWGEVEVSSSVVTLNQMEGARTRAEILFHCRGTATEALQVITTPPLNLVSPSVVETESVDGSIEADIHLKFAFDELPRMEHDTRAEIRNLRLAQVVAGLDLTGGDFDLAVSTKGSTFKGTANLGGVSATLHYSQSVEGDLEQLAITTADVGTLLDSLDISGRLSGGHLRVALERALEPGNGTWSGSADVDKVRILQAPLLARLLTMASLSGLVSTLSSKGLTVGHARADITASADRICCRSIRISIDQLEITGSIDYCRTTGQVESEGLMIPAASLQRLVSAVPIVGSFLEGLGKKNLPIVATRFTLTGPLSQPEIRVAPLSSLAPDILRELGII